MKIGIIIPIDLIKRIPFGGASGFILSVLPHLETSSCSFGPGVNGTELDKPYRLYEQHTFVPVYGMKYPPRLPGRIRGLMGYAMSRRKILDSGVDVLYVHSPECALPFLFGRRRLPVVFHQHGSANPVTMSKFRWARLSFLPLFAIFDAIHRMIYKRAAWIIAIDRLCREQAVRAGAGDKLSVIMNAVDTDTFRIEPALRSEMRSRHGCGDGDTVLLFSGRVEEVKGIDQLIRSIPLLNARGSFRLFIAGDGSLRDSLGGLARELGVDREVRFLGKVPHRDLPGYYNMADAFLLPSKYEGVPMVILEALACGTPVIATKVGGIPDLIKPGVNGLLLESGDARAIAEAVSTLMSSVPAREEVCDTVAQLSSKRVAHDLVRLFESVAAMDRAKKKEPGDPEHGHGRSSGGEEESLTPEP